MQTQDSWKIEENLMQTIFGSGLIQKMPGWNKSLQPHKAIETPNNPACAVIDGKTEKLEV